LSRRSLAGSGTHRHGYAAARACSSSANIHSTHARAWIAVVS
jgi:hypothetical protein